jgi:hypothetical protein
MVVQVNEPVQVGAVFRKAEVVPRWFFYHGRKITVREVTYCWKENSGRTLFHHFSVSDGASLYELVFDPERLCWKLEAIEDSAP